VSNKYTEYQLLRSILFFRLGVIDITNKGLPGR